MKNNGISGVTSVTLKEQTTYERGPGIPGPLLT
jgi:hypothetical protein